MAAQSITRRSVLTSASLVAAAPAAAAIPDAADTAATLGVRLIPMPVRIFKTADASHERTESWVFWLFVQTDVDRQLTVSALETRLLSAGRLVRTTREEAQGARALTIRPPLTPRQLDGGASPTPIFWPQAVRIRGTAPLFAAVDSVEISLELATAGAALTARAAFPIETYRQVTRLIYPFRGKGVITQAGATNGGHRNRSGQFALDGVGLDDAYGVNKPGGGRKSTDYYGWGRTLMAPADGRFVRVRADRPDQPDPEASDPKYYAPEHPDGGDPGNHVVIDHGNSEFSMLAHFQAGSLKVKVGDRVRQGQPLGRLGSSGDTNTPHCHFQLQSGPDWEWSDGLPCKFANIPDQTLVRGVFFDAR